MNSLVTVGWVDPEQSRNPARLPTARRVNPAVHVSFAAQAQAERRRRDEIRAAVAKQAGQ